MAKKGYRYESEIHLGLLGIICLLLLLNLVSNYAAYSARSAEREQGLIRLQGVAKVITRQLQVDQLSSLTTSFKSRLLAEHGLTDLALLAPRPEPWNELTSRQWLVTVAGDLPLARLTEVADALVAGSDQELCHVDGDQYMLTYPIRQGNGERLLVLAADIPELAVLDRGAKLVLISGGIASALVLAIYLLLSQRIFWPLRRIRKATSEAGLQGAIDDSAESVVEQYEQIIAELRHTEAELRQANSVITEMSAGMAHQLRNSLGAINGFAALLKKQLQKRGEDATSADVLLDESHQAKELISRFLDLSRPLACVKQTVSLPEFLSEVVSSAQADPGIGQQQVVLSPVPDCAASFDPLLLKQCLLNLLDNAAKAYQGREGRISMTASTDGTDLTVQIEDWAGGISPEVKETLFTPFVSSRPSGTGLGLAFVKRVITSHGGSIEVDSTLGRGSRFTLLLPGAVRARSASPEGVAVR